MVTLWRNEQRHHTVAIPSVILSSPLVDHGEKPDAKPFFPVWIGGWHGSCQCSDMVLSVPFSMQSVEIMVHRIVFAYDIRLKIISHIFIGDIDSCQKEFDRHAFFHAFIEWLEVVIRFLPIQILGIFHQIIIAKVVVTVKIGNHTLNLRKRIFRCIIDFHRRWHIQHIRLTIYPIAIHAKRYRLRIVIWMGIESVEEIIIQSRYFLRPFSFNL